MQPRGQGSPYDIRTAIVERARSRRSEIEEAIFARIEEAVPNAVGRSDPDYQAGMRAAIMALIDYGLDGIGEEATGWERPIPPAVAAQARRAARHGVSLGSVMRRYIAGSRTLGEFIAEEAERSRLSIQGPALHHLRTTQEALLEHVTAAIEHEYDQELERVASSPEQRRAELVDRLLAGKPADASALAELDYAFENAWHVGIIATGERPKTDRVLADLARGLRLSVLLVPRADGTTWAWLGGREVPPTDIERRLSTKAPSAIVLAIGEAAHGVAGWRLTHQEARRAFPVALRQPQELTRYSAVALLAAALRDDVLARLLTEHYLSPLNGSLRNTLRAYLVSEHNVSTAAAALGVDRGTVGRRLRTIERRLGRSLITCHAEIEIALRLEQLEKTPSNGSTTPGRS